ncbi:F-box/kelch-repeat protein At3g23880-like [Bidens hawaiensis]|uniref:F-box/kelch-repeat protein At3g23880-like n=1 Tax=Bidens hawaiensis TaxID=980011 RepID=UPI00404AAEF7
MALDDSQQSKKTKTLHSTLPKDIAVEILLKLPVKSVLRCKSVCKSWYSLISDPQFVKSHLAISTRSNNHYRQHRLIIFGIKGRMIKTYNPHDVLYDNSINSALELDHPYKHMTLNYFWFGLLYVGCCNGLLCMAIEKDVLIIWNPSTRKSYILPPTGYRKIELGYVRYGFGYQESTDDYKVVELSRRLEDITKQETMVRIYSLKNGNWKEIGAFPHGLRLDDFGPSSFCNGALHWIAGKDLGTRIIVSLDLANETYGEVLQPVYDAGHKYMTLGSLREQLCVLCDNPRIRADLWVMKVYGVKDSWTKLVSIPYLTDPGIYIDRFSMPLCVSNDGKYLLHSGYLKLIVYDSKHSSLSEIQNADKYVNAFVIVESLVSPMPATSLGDRYDTTDVSTMVKGYNMHDTKVEILNNQGLQQFSNVAIHWIAGKDLGPRIIVSLDLEKETYGEGYHRIRADVWVMKVYGVKDSWTKLVSIPYSTDPRRDRFFIPLCVSTDGKILLQFGWKKLIVYDSNKSSFSVIQNLDICFGACTFVESLVSPMPAAALGDI